MSSWQTSIGRESPLRGSPDDYDVVMHDYRDMTDAVATSSTEFQRAISAREVGDLHGMTADQLVTVVSGVDSIYQHLPTIADDVIAIMNTHRDGLADLMQRNDAARAVADDRAVALANAIDQLDEAQRNLNWADNRVRHYTGLDDDHALERWQRRRRNWQHQRDSWAGTRDNAQAELEQSRQTHSDLADEERWLAEATARRLSFVDLGSMADPSLVERAVIGSLTRIYDMGANLVNASVDLVQAIADGDLGAALWALSDLIDAVLDIAIVLSFVLAPGIMGPLMVVTSIAKAAVTVTLALAGEPHPETGRVITHGEAAATVLTMTATAAFGSALSKAVPLPGGQAGQRSILGNIRNAARPTSQAGKQLYGGAATTSRNASVKSVAGTIALDEVTASFESQVDAQLTAFVDRQFGNPILTTAVDDWTSNTSVVDLARTSPQVSAALSKVTADIRASLGACTSLSPTEFHMAGVK